MIRLAMKNCNAILTKKLQKHQHYHQVDFINMFILQVKKHYLEIKVAYKKEILTKMHILFMKVEN